MIKIITFVQFTFKRHSPVSVHQLIGKQVAPEVINFQLKSNSTTAQINIFSIKEAMVLQELLTIMLLSRINCIKSGIS